MFLVNIPILRVNSLERIQLLDIWHGFRFAGNFWEIKFKLVFKIGLFLVHAGIMVLVT